MPNKKTDRQAKRDAVKQPHQHYTELISQLGTIEKAADQLGTTSITIARRCSGSVALTREHFLAVATKLGIEDYRAPI